jgi:phosphatidylcholine synthase
MKSKDNYFIGFPAAWNVVIVYLYLLDFAPWLSLVTILVLAGLTLTKMKFLHPFRVKQFMPLNIGVTLLWMAVCALLIMQYPLNQTWLLLVWGLTTAYFVAICLWRTVREWLA